MDTAGCSRALSAGPGRKEAALRFLGRWEAASLLQKFPREPARGGSDPSALKTPHGVGWGLPRGLLRPAQDAAPVSLNQGVGQSAVRKWTQVLLLLNVIILDKNPIKRREGEAEAEVRGWGGGAKGSVGLAAPSPFPGGRQGMRRRASAWWRERQELCELRAPAQGQGPPSGPLCCPLSPGAA